MSDKFDIIIVGAGPAGCCCALMLANTGLKLAIIDKSSFPRDKICGDALSFAVLNNLKKLPQGIFDRFLNEFNSKLPSYGVRFVSPSSEILDIDFNSPANSSYAPGYISKREDFDFFLFKELKNYPNINIIQNCRINDVTYSESINLITETNLYSAKIVVAADGANSIIRKKLSGNIIDKNRQCTGIKAYFKGVSGFREGNFIELHFLKDILPGYFWIFPLPNGMANVGLGMLNKDIHKNKTILKKQFTSIISSNTLIAPRFINSELIGNYQADYLPLGTKKYNISGERFLLTGDAACLTDPFTGEGVANAMFSGRWAAEHIKNCFKTNDFSATFNKNYDNLIYNKIWKELKLSSVMQALAKNKTLLNYVIRKANKNQGVKEILNSMLSDMEIKKQLSKPSFYFKLLFK